MLYIELWKERKTWNCEKKKKMSGFVTVLPERVNKYWKYFSSLSWYLMYVIPSSNCSLQYLNLIMQQYSVTKRIQHLLRPNMHFPYLHASGQYHCSWVAVTDYPLTIYPTVKKMRILRKESEQSPKYRLLGLVEHLWRRGMLVDTLVSAFEDAVLNLIDTLLRKVSNVYLIHILE